VLKIIARPVRVDERDLLVGNEAEPLFLRDLSGRKTLRVDAAPRWSHETLDAVVLRADVVEFVKSNYGADAFLGGQWIGSSEI
jgi:hypothetical protein